MTQRPFSLPFFRYLSEVRIRALTIFFSTLCTLCVSYINWFPLLSLSVSPVLQSTAVASFLFTEPQSAFFAILKLSSLATFCVILPFLWYHLWSFFVPSYYQWERQKLTRLLLSSLFFWALSLFLLYVLLLPTLLSFFLQYQFESERVTLRIEPRIDAYVDLFILLSACFFCVSQLPFVFLFLFSRGIWKQSQMRRYRRNLQPVFFLLAAVCAPPDLFVQLGLTLLVSLFFECCLWFGCLSLRLTDHRRGFQPTF